MNPLVILSLCIILFACSTYVKCDSIVSSVDGSMKPLDVATKAIGGGSFNEKREACKLSNVKMHDGLVYENAYLVYKTNNLKEKVYEIILIEDRKEIVFYRKTFAISCIDIDFSKKHEGIISMREGINCKGKATTNFFITITFKGEEALNFKTHYENNVNNTDDEWQEVENYYDKYNS